MDKKIPKVKKEKAPERDNDVSNSSSISISGPTIPQRPYKLGKNTFGITVSLAIILQTKLFSYGFFFLLQLIKY